MGLIIIIRVRQMGNFVVVRRTVRRGDLACNVVMGRSSAGAGKQQL